MAIRSYIWLGAALVILAGTALVARGLSSDAAARMAMPDSATTPLTTAEPLPYTSDTGLYPVTSALATLFDPAREKELEIRAYYPQATGPLPVIVFSHGLGGSRDVGPELMEHWAGHGYVVVCPTHADSVELGRRQGIYDGVEHASNPTREIRKLLRAINSDYSAWRNRALDVSFLIDSLPTLPEYIPKLAGMLDTSTIGVGGHSYGAFTTMLSAGATVNPAGLLEDTSWRDERPAAFLVLSGQGVGRLTLDAESWQSCHRPMMVMSGTNDTASGNMPVESRRDPFFYSPPGDKYLVWIEDAYHASFTGKLASDNTYDQLLGVWVDSVLGNRDAASGIEATDQQAIFEYVKTASLAFWDAYLKNTPEAQRWLASDALPGYSGGTVEYLVK